MLLYVPFTSPFWSFCHNRCWILWKYLSTSINMTIFFVLQFNSFHHTDWWIGIEKSFNPWNKPHLIMVFDPFNVLGWRGCEEKGSLLYYWWEYKLVQPLWKIVWRFLKVTENRPTIWSCNPSSGCISRGRFGSKGYMHPNIRCSTVQIATWKQHKCPSIEE